MKLLVNIRLVIIEGSGWGVTLSDREDRDQLETLYSKTHTLCSPEQLDLAPAILRNCTFGKRLGNYKIAIHECTQKDLENGTSRRIHVTDSRYPKKYMPIPRKLQSRIGVELFNAVHLSHSFMY
ncbi:hypothetical protein OCU04_011333 [Sclerotinia nivalis]|uniref:Uncharacterized protein n=1 Tax=Sclerotinia nivalis TaxID=352851 RepID=A0A9X0DEM5_9HELO|nr:hypothetical protein OCU04_011333 [Sclerotinia nivalis]